MIRSLSLAAALALAAASLPAPAPAQNAKPLRTLVYAVQFSANTTNEEQSSGFTGVGGATSTGSAMTKRSSHVDDSGPLTADVIAATNDGGLVIDVSFAGKAGSQPKVRVAVYPDGSLSYQPGVEISPEATRLLPLLARGILADHDVTPGSSWVSQIAPPAKGAYKYHVTAVEGTSATLGIDIDTMVPGPKGFDEHGKATVIYDTHYLCPARFSYDGTSRHQPSMDQYVTTSAHLVATLVSDSFQKK